MKTKLRVKIMRMLRVAELVSSSLVSRYNDMRLRLID